MGVHLVPFAGILRDRQHLVRLIPNRLSSRGVLPPASVIHGPDNSVPPHYFARAVMTVHDFSALAHPNDYPPGFPESFLGSVDSHIKKHGFVICDSDFTLGELWNRYPTAPATAIHLGVDESYFLAVPDEGWRERNKLTHPYMLHVGAWVPRKRVPLLLEAFALVACRHPDVELVLAGPDGRGWYSDADVVEGWLSDHSRLADRVRIMGQVPESMVTSLFACASCVITCSRHEGFGLTVLQGMAAGRPVVAPRTTAIPEVGGDTITYAEDPDSAESFADAVDRALSDTAKPKMARERARMFSWKRAASLTGAAYRTARDI